MSKIKAIALKPYFLVFFCICIALILSAFNLNSTKVKANKKQIESQVTTSLKELEIVQVNQLGPSTLQVIIKNGYQKDITALVASSNGDKDFRRDYVFSELEKDQKLGAGASDEFLYNLNPGEYLIVTGVLFSDKSFLGDYSAIKGVLDKRLGMKVQLTRINPYLELLNKEGPQSAITTLNRTKQIAETLSLEKDDKSPMSQDYEYGLRHGRIYILTNLSAMQANLDEKIIDHRFNQQSVTGNPDAYENFRKRCNRVYNHFKNLERRL